MFKRRWSVDGYLVELVNGKLTVSSGPGGPTVLELKKVGQKAGEVPLTLDGRAYRLSTSRGFLGPVSELRTAGGDLLPECDAYASRTPAPGGTSCQAHRSPAVVACARCGAFACERCLGADRVHCATCMLKLTSEAQRRPRQAVYLAPALVYMPLGGALGGLLGVGAASASFAIARKLESRAARVGAAVGIHLVAVAVLLAIQVAIARAR